jgi:DNA-binding XRE family transcriptional regulator
MCGASTSSVVNWELGTCAPALRFIPRIVAFIGFEPTSPDASHLGQRLVHARRLQGLSQEALAAHLGIDPSTLAAWEAARRRVRPSRRVTHAIDEFLSGR